MANRTYWPMSEDCPHYPTPLPFACFWCESHFKCENLLKRHILKVHKYNCYYCFRNFSQLYQYMFHTKYCTLAKKDILYFVKFYLNYGR
jgi:hypothetical protein